MKHLLITGATGFIGSHAVERALKAGFHVTAISRSLSHERLPGVVYRQADLFDPEQTADVVASIRPTHLLHTAWVVTPSECWTSPDNHRWVDASRTLLRTFAEVGGQHAVVTGSCAEYDWAAPQPCDEWTTPLGSQSHYSRCKNELREWATDFAEKHGIRFAWARLFFLYGPREHPDRLVSSVIRGLLAGQHVACTTGTQSRDYLHVEDAADALISLLQSDLSGPVNIASGDVVAVREVIERIARVCGRPELVRFGARATSPSDPPLLSANISRQTNELKWLPRFGLADGLDVTIRWWLTQRPPRLNVDGKIGARLAS